MVMLLTNSSASSNAFLLGCSPFGAYSPRQNLAATTRLAVSLGDT